MISRFGGWLLIIVITFAVDLSPVQSASEEQLANVSIRLYMGKTLDDNFADAVVGEAVKLLKNIDSKKPTVLYVHGYNEDLKRESVRSIISAYLKRQDHNVLAVDYSQIAQQNYLIVAPSASGVGKIVAKALNEMVLDSLDSTTLHVVGHSLGGQVAGYIGRNVDFKLPRITALDPAGPGFYAILDHLSSSDAESVDVIHTDSGAYGFGAKAGGADFYPNSGIRIQPGCPYLFWPGDNGDFCSHHRSWRFYAESVINEKAFIGIECESYSKFRTKKCKNNKKVPMGFATPVGTKGRFYLRTNDKSPFGLGGAGAIPK